MLNCREVVQRSSVPPCPSYRRQRLRQDAFAKGDSLFPLVTISHPTFLPPPRPHSGWTEYIPNRDQRGQAQGDDDVVELMVDDDSECDLSDYLTMVSQWSDTDEQAEWWHLPPSRMVSNSSPSSLTTVTPLPTSQLSSTREAAEVEPDVEREGEEVEDVGVVRGLRE
eukprot:TsM_001234800 transcript=TsM_001234800 gene=TsM_001234800